METPIIDWRKDSQAKKGEHFLNAMSQIYISMAVLNLNDCTAVVLSSKYDEEIVGYEIPWDMLLKRFTDRRLYPEDQNRIYSILSIPNLLLFWESELNEKSIEVRCQQAIPGICEWVEVVATVFDREARQILFTTRSISETKLRKRVLDEFVYHQNCDFFILVDLEKNNYKIFDVCTGLLPIPEMGGIDYTADMIKYNRKYVVKSESEEIISIMQLENIRKHLAEQDEYTYALGIITDSGEYRRARMQLIMFDRENHLVIITRSDITSIYLEEKRRNEQLFSALRAAQHDLLTGLYNQATTEKIVSQMLNSYQGRLAAILFIDVDNFKMVNDTLGHLHGNEILKKLAGFLQNLLTVDSVVGRVGGDEFLLFMSNASSIQEIHDIGKRICGAFNEFRELTAELPVSCSVGISLYPQDGLKYEVLVRKADQALYRSKRYGKNNYSMYSEDMNMTKYSSLLSEID